MEKGELIEHAVRSAQKLMLERGEIVPMHHAVSAMGEEIVVLTPWRNEEEKEDSMAKLSFIFWGKRVTRYVTMGESWFADTSEDEGRTYQAWRDKNPESSLEHYPHRSEGIQVCYVDRFEKRLFMWKVIRDEKGKVVRLEKSRIFEEEGAKVSGRLTDLLPDPKMRPPSPEVERQIERILGRHPGGAP